MKICLCFNPCFNGTYSLTELGDPKTTLGSISFNPCFNGTYSLTDVAEGEEVGTVGCFNPCFNGTYSLTYKGTKKSKRSRSVLILVLMELTL